MIELNPLLLLSSFFLVLFALAEILYIKFKVKAEYTRKMVHIGTGILTLLFPLMLHSHWSVLIICSSFLILLLLSLKFRFLQGINNVERFTLGSVMYPVAVYLCFLYFEKSGGGLPYYYLPILTLALCDPAAALVGTHCSRGKYNFTGETKSLTGSTAFFLVAFLLCLFLMPGPLYKAVVFALCTTVAEGLSTKGMDNLTIPLTGIAVLHFVS